MHQYVLLIKRLYKEEELIDLIQEEKITLLDFIGHRSEESKTQYERFCQENGLDQESQKSALAFWDYLLLEEKHNHLDTDHNNIKYS